MAAQALAARDARLRPALIALIQRASASTLITELLGCGTGRSRAHPPARRRDQALGARRLRSTALHMSAVAATSAAANLATPQRAGGRRSSGGGSGSSGAPMLRAAFLSARTRLLGRATAFSSSLLQPHAGVRDASKVTAAAAARAARTDAAAALGDASSDAKVRRAWLATDILGSTG